MKIRAKVTPREYIQVTAERCINPACRYVHCVVGPPSDQFSFAVTDEDWEKLFLQVATLQKEMAGKPQ